MKQLSHRQVADLCRGLALQLHAGISLADGVFLLAEEETRFREEYHTLGRKLDAGESLSAAMSQTGIIPGFVCRMAEVGSRTGRLEETLDSLAEHYETRYETGRAIRNALSYPAVVFTLMLIVVAVLLTKVLPVFDQVYVSLGSRLTGISAWLLYLGQGLNANWPAVIAVLAVLAGIFVLYAKWDPLRERVNGWFGDKGIGKYFHDAYFAQAMAMGLASGLPVEDALELAGELLSDTPSARARRELCSERLREGKSLPEAMEEAKLLAPAESRLLAVGLRGGNGDAVLAQIARRLSRQTWEKLEDALRRIEPMLVLVSSLLVGVILLSVMLPLVDIMSTIG